MNKAETLDRIHNRHLSRRLLATGILVVFFMALILMFGTFTYDKLPPINMTKTEVFLYGMGNFGKAPDTFVSGEEYYSKNIISSYFNAESDKAKLAYMIYRYACLTYGTTAQKSWHLYADGSVSALGASGDLLASGYRYEKRRDGTYLADTVLQNVNILSNVAGEGLGITALNIARSLVEYGEQRVYSADYDYLRVADSKSFYVDDTYDMAQATFSKKATKYNNATHVPAKKEAGYVYREYDENWYDEYGLSSPEKTDHIINLESIVSDSVSVVEQKDGNNNKYYEVKFDIDTTKILSSGTTATYYFEQFMINHLDLLDGAFSMFKVNIKYNTLTITMEVWDSGYFRSWRTDEEWTVTAALGSLKVPATTKVTSLEYYSYDPNDNLFDELLPTFTAEGNYTEYVD